jgi:hypothetical protein
MEEELEEQEIDDGYYENNDLYIYEIHYYDEYEDEYGYEDSDDDYYYQYNDGRYTQYELLFKDAQRCGWVGQLLNKTL